ncbi:MAG: hypothetical protein ACLVIY_10525 [Anaerobutyricum soehngenii]
MMRLILCEQIARVV